MGTPVSAVAQAVAALDAVDAAGLEVDQRVELVLAVEQCEAALAAIKVRAIAAVADAYEALGMVASEARHEIGAALRLSPVTAADRTAVAVALRDTFPRTLALLAAGRISWLQAAHVARGTEGLPDATASLVEDSVLARLPRLTAAETRRAVADAAVRVDPAGAQARVASCRHARHIDRMPDRDGQVGWWFPIPVEQEGEAWAAVTRLAKARRAARRAAGLDDPGLDALRVDVAVGLLTGGAGEERWPTAGSAGPRCSCGGRQTAAVVVDLPTVLGLAAHPGEVPGHGTVTADVARAMAADRDWIRWTVDPLTGVLLDVGSRSYRPPGRLQRFLRARHPRCVFPGCPKPAQSCDLDHITSFRADGRTCRSNLAPLCRQHHNAKTHGGWSYTQDGGTGAITWTSPLGHTYLVQRHAPLRT